MSRRRATERSSAGRVFKVLLQELLKRRTG
jgi:hypothetical protein